MKTDSASTRQRGLRKILIAVAVIVVVGVATFYGTSYVANIQPTSTQSGSVSTSQSSGQTAVSSTSSGSTSGQSSVQTTTGGESTTSQSSVQTSSISCSSAPVIALDGSTINYWTDGNVSAVSVSLSTTKAPDVILVFVTITSNPEGSADVPPAVTNVTDGTDSLTFHHRASVVSSVTNVGSDKVSEEEWYAISNQILSNDSITVNVAKANSTVTVIAFGVSGANTKSPFDSSTTIPARANGTSFGEIQASISTSNGPDLVVGGAAMATNLPVAGSGYTLIQSDQGKGAQDDPAAEYGVVCGSGANYGVSFAGQGSVGGGGFLAPPQTWVIIGDALVQATP
jgi:hypothetical protein